jgi:hypothetical protein
MIGLSDRHHCRSSLRNCSPVKRGGRERVRGKSRRRGKAHHFLEGEEEFEEKTEMREPSLMALM